MAQLGPELARGSGRALRIFKAETKGLVDDAPDEIGPLAGIEGSAAMGAFERPSHEQQPRS